MGFNFYKGMVCKLNLNKRCKLILINAVYNMKIY
jgi:hypothetical protein